MPTGSARPVCATCSRTRPCSSTGSPCAWPGNDPQWLRQFADQTATVYRRRGIELDDVIKLFEGIRASVRSVLTAEELVPADVALDEAIAVFRWHRRLAGDARKRNPIIAAIYKGG